MDSKADSPVIGVMLMLVATVILAAVVTSYSGGLVSEESKAPQASFDVRFSQTEGLFIYHTGGDVLQGRDVKIRLEYTKAWGGFDGIGAVIDQANITHKNQNRTFSAGVSFGPGDVAVVEPSKLPASGAGGNFTNSTHFLGITNPANVGKTLRVIIIDEVSGKMILKTEVPINR